jgi:hypothetical protein
MRPGAETLKPFWLALAVVLGGVAGRYFAGSLGHALTREAPPRTSAASAPASEQWNPLKQI